MPPELADRLPPGQYVEPGFPVLTAGPTPSVAPADWSFRVDGMVGTVRAWTWDEFAELPSENVPCDIHCVTKWSKFDTSFRGVSVDTLLAEASPSGEHVMAMSYGGYTTNLALDDLLGGRAWVVTEHEGAALPRARRPGAAAGTPPLLLEERQVGRGTASHGPRRARLLGAERLPQPRRPVARAALLERLTPAAPRAPGRWQVATVSAIRIETPRVKTFRLELPMWMPHLPGQHYDVRLTAPDGYQAQRSYSIASSPLDERVVELTVDRLDEGEVSSYFHDADDKVERRSRPRSLTPSPRRSRTQKTSRRRSRASLGGT